MVSRVRLAITAAVLAGAIGLLSVVSLRDTAWEFWKGSKREALQAFESEKELLGYIETAKAEIDRRWKSVEASLPLYSVSAPDPAVESITNVQTDGVDEGGIVKRAGDFLIILRRGRLFSVAIADGQLRPVSWLNAYGPNGNPERAWYDELLVYQDRVVVVGYSYSNLSTELGLFRLSPDGHLGYEATYQLRSSDYYTARNYASRLIGSRLIFYAPLPLDSTEDPLPALRRLHDATSTESQGDFERIVTAAQVYRPIEFEHWIEDPALHSVTTCDLSLPDLSCTATVVMGSSWTSKFYVSTGAVYIWTNRWSTTTYVPSMRSVLYRVPLDGSVPSAIRAAGMPIDQFSFLERDEVLHVLVREWSDSVFSRDYEQQIALLRIPTAMFGDGSRQASSTRWRMPLAGSSPVHNRFIGHHLLYGTSDSGTYGNARALHVVNYLTGAVAELSPNHAIDRIENMGGDALVVGTAGGLLHFSGVDLSMPPRFLQHHSIETSTQGETRSHGFFYRPDGHHAGIIGLPIRDAILSRPTSSLLESSAAIVFLRNEHARFDELGQLSSKRTPADAGMDMCVASCTDWYGNSRPIFLDDRILALMGYELVEGVLHQGRLQEAQRVTFLPDPE